MMNTLTLPSISSEISLDEIVSRTDEAKRNLGRSLIILGHHYQRDDVIQFANHTGDSFGLSKCAAKNRDAEYIVFCGVHFMAETADILAAEYQKVMLPDLKAGCSMADMADIDQVEVAWDEVTSNSSGKIVPITYMNSTAAIKAFCGRNDGVVCTSSNAAGVFKWAFNSGDKIIFLPDQHLGRNTAYATGISLNDMIVWDPHEGLGGNTTEEIDKAKIILWKGHCSVHQNFLPQYVDFFRKQYPGVNILVHPECSFEVVQKADYVGSTSYIIKMIEQADPGSKWAIGTEHHLVNRLKNLHQDKFISTLSPYTCQCSTMYRIDPIDLMKILENLLEGKVINQIKVQDDIAELARIALDRMLSIL